MPRNSGILKIQSIIPESCKIQVENFNIMRWYESEEETWRCVSVNGWFTEFVAFKRRI